MKALKRTGTIVISVVLWIIILIAALYAFTTIATRDNQNVSSIGGYTPMVVKSDSMAPTFEKGDLIFIKKCDTTKLEVGDVICFHTIIDNEYALNTHRIKEIAAQGDVRSYTTMGDNNKGIADQHIISDGDIVGKYVGHLSKMGNVMNFLSSSSGFLIVIPMLLFFIYQVYNLIMISVRLKKAIAVETAKEVENAKNSAQDAGKEAEAAKAALDEAKKMREEAEAIRAKAEAELAKAKKAKEEQQESASEDKDGEA